ncbi:MAG: hypothetical protein L0Y80_00975 [Ignavibacteriae bacterium]|nr:hypothetical protein [Ignavibacteriota bacterium]
MNTITINNKEYRFRERVVIGKVLEAERLSRQIDLSFLAKSGTGLLARIKERLAWRKVNRLWLSLCTIIFENPDSGLRLDSLTPVEIQEVPRRFFAFMEETQKPSGDTAKEKPRLCKRARRSCP